MCLCVGGFEYMNTVLGACNMCSNRFILLGEEEVSFYFLRASVWGWQDGSAVKSTHGCSYTGLAPLTELVTDGCDLPFYHVGAVI